MFLAKNFRLLLIALQFLTRLPVSLAIPPSEAELVQSERYFPVVGLLLGVILVITNYLLAPYLPLVGVNVVLIFLVMLYSGGLHLDGFADCLDAFYSGRDKEKMLLIMKDSRIGVMGAIGLMLYFALLLTFLHVIPQPVRWKTLLIMPVISRAMIVNLAFFGIYAREEGLAKVFIEQAAGSDWMISLGSTAVFAVYLFGIKGVVLVLLSYAFSLSILRMSVRRIEGITGDVLGLTNEVITLAVPIIVKFLYLKPAP